MGIIANEKTVIPGIINTYRSYRKSIPKDHQKPWLPERILRLLTVLGAHSGCRQQITKNSDGWITLITEQSKVDTVVKLLPSFLETLLVDADVIEQLKSTELPKALEGVSASKHFEKLKDMLK
jgi:hypothetical protein